MEQTIKSTNLIKGDLDLINRFSRRNLVEDEIFAFTLTLCDNEIDRDYEAFDENALQILADMFIGKTGIFDHNPTSKNQTARVYATYLEKTDEITRYGSPKVLLKAKAYMVRSKRLEDTILEIDAGIIKEVSIGCSVKNKVCSICSSESSDQCGHTPGQMYGEDLCYIKLQNPADAYEWSFVAVPAQKGAGVTKNYKTTGTVCEKEHVIKNNYIINLRKEVIKLAFLNGFMKNDNVFSTIVEKMNLDELEGFKKEFAINLKKSMPQLQLGYTQTQTEKNNNEFKI